MSKNLVELMATKAWSKQLTVTHPLMMEIATDMLSVVKEHIGEVAECCDNCVGGWINGIERCPECKGLGVIARTDGGDK
jgi:hypothetical protein